MRLHAFPKAKTCCSAPAHAGAAHTDRNSRALMLRATATLLTDGPGPSVVGISLAAASNFLARNDKTKNGIALNNPHFFVDVNGRRRAASAADQEVADVRDVAPGKLLAWQIGLCSAGRESRRHDPRSHARRAHRPERSSARDLPPRSVCAPLIAFSGAAHGHDHLKRRCFLVRGAHGLVDSCSDLRGG